jgi:hypothetical protein
MTATTELAAEASGAGVRAFLRREAPSFLELFALCGIAIVQPLLDILSKNTGLFITRGTTAFQAVALVLVIAFVPPLIGWCVELTVGALVPRARRMTHAVLAAAIIGVIVMEAAKKATSLGVAPLIVLAVIGGVVGGAAILRSSIVRQFVRYLAFAVPIFALLFLGASPVTDVVFSSHPASAANVGFKTPHRVVLVVMDEFPDMSLLDGNGHVDKQLFPNFASLERESTWYRNETTVAPYTELAVPAILTGQYPKRPDAVPFVSDYPENLFTMFGKAYSLNVHEAVTRLCPERLCTGSSQSGGFSSLVTQSADLWGQFASPQRTQFSFDEGEGTKTALRVANQFVSSLHPSSKLSLDFVHIELPHEPWHYLPNLQDSLATGKIQGATYLSWSSQAAADAARQRHLLQVQASDTLFGQIVAKLKRIGAYDDSLVIMTADHGVAFTRDEPLRSVSRNNYPQIMWPPLFVKYPGQHAGVIDDRPAESVDIMPTIADVVGATIPWRVDGQSLRAAPRAEFPRRMYQWGAHAYEPPNALKAPAGRDYLEFDGAAGFAEVLRARAAPPGADASLRIYRDAPFGDLVGREVTPLIHDEPGREKAALSSRSLFDRVDPNSPRIPWAYGEGFFNDLNGSSPVAIALNGRIVAVTTAESLDSKGNAFFTYIIPPELVRPGGNVPSVYLIRGSARDPSLDPVWLHP